MCDHPSSLVRRLRSLIYTLGFGVLSVLALACDEGHYSLVLEYPSEAEYTRARHVRLFVQAGVNCSSIERGELTPFLEFDPHGEVPPLGQIATGPNAFLAEVQDRGCAVFLEGCTQATITDGEHIAVRIFLQGTNRPGCPATARCDEGLCHPIDGSAGLDAVADARTLDTAGSDRRGVDVPSRDLTQDDAGPDDAGPNDTPQIDAQPSDARTPDRSAPDTTPSDGWRPDTTPRDTTLADAWQPDAWRPDAWQPDAWRPDAWQPDTWQPDAWQPDATDPSWLVPGWSERLYMRIHNAYSVADLVDFPVLVRLNPDNFDYGVARGDGADLRFVDADGLVLPHEVERWTVDGESTIWVGVPRIPAGSNDTELWLYYGKADASDTQNAAGVWTNHHRAVLHLEGTGATDSSGQGNPGSLTNTTAVDGAVAGARAFGGDGDYIDISSLNNADFPQTTGTVSAWVYGDLVGQGSGDAIFDAYSSSRDHFFIRPNDANELQTAAQGGGSLIVNRRESLDSDDNNVWMQVALTFDTAADEMWVYINGWERGPFNLPGFTPADQITRFGNGFAGRIDEIRISDAVRSLDWMRATYDTMTGRFLLFDSPVERPDVLPRTGTRVSGAVALYEFDEGSGTTVHDRSGLEPALDLSIAHPSRVTWVGEGIDIVGSTIISTAGPATRLTNACSTSGEITVEAWLMPDSNYLTGPARIVTLSLNPSYRNFTFGQASHLEDNPQGYYVLRYRTNETNLNGSSHTVLATPVPHTPYDTVYTDRPSHVVFTRTAGAVSAYIDGIEVLADEPWTGATDNWDTDMAIALGNEFEGTSLPGFRRPWLGALYLVAIYCHALTALEVEQNYAAGI